MCVIAIRRYRPTLWLKDYSFETLIYWGVYLLYLQNNLVLELNVATYLFQWLFDK